MVLQRRVSSRRLNILLSVVLSRAVYPCLCLCFCSEWLYEINKFRKYEILKKSHTLEKFMRALAPPYLKIMPILLLLFSSLCIINDWWNTKYNYIMLATKFIYSCHSVWFLFCALFLSLVCLFVSLLSIYYLFHFIFKWTDGRFNGFFDLCAGITNFRLRLRMHACNIRHFISALVSFLAYGGFSF